MTIALRIIYLLVMLIPALDAGETAVMFWNVENLFHPDNDPGKNDEEFTPGSPKHYTMNTYRYKLEQLSRVINKAQPDIIGFAETENIRVLEDLSRYLFKYDCWQPVLIEGPDQRGIDVSLMFRSDRFQMAASLAHPVRYQSGARTRDILQVDLVLLENLADTLTLLVTHFPSRYGGEAASSPRREQVAAQLKAVISDIRVSNPERDILIMGDFNDTIDDPSLQILIDYGLKSLISPAQSGSYFYREEWFDFDHLFGTPSLFDDLHFSIQAQSAGTIRYDFMLDTSRSGKTKYPRRFYSGDRFNGGFSDHLPLFIKLNY